MLSAWSITSDRAAAQTPVDFNRDVRPILSENCFFCHGQDANQRQADLRLDVGEAAVDAGAIVAGDSAASSLIERIKSDDPDFMMPPPDSNRRLNPDQKQTLERWIDQGASYQKHWAFVAPNRPALPAVRSETWIRNPIDRFVLAKLESVGLNPSPEPDRATLIKTVGDRSDWLASNH